MGEARDADMISLLWTHNGRRAAAFGALLGGCVIMTIFGAIAIYLVSGNELYTLYLGLAAHAQITLGMTAFTAMFVKRSIKAGKDGIEISDAD
jgi:Mg/Co/Ni transporter MgtE